MSKLGEIGWADESLLGLRPQPPNWASLLETAKKPLTDSDKAIMEEALSDDYEKAFQDELPEQEPEQQLPLEEKISENEIMGEISDKLMLHKTETRHVEKVVRPIIEKLVNKRDEALNQLGAWKKEDMVYLHERVSHWNNKYLDVLKENEAMQKCVEVLRIYDYFTLDFRWRNHRDEALAKLDALKGGQE